MEGIPVDVTQDELQKQLDTYFDKIKSQNAIPEAAQKPFAITKLNIGKPFYLSEDALKDK